MCSVVHRVVAFGIVCRGSEFNHSNYESYNISFPVSYFEFPFFFILKAFGFDPPVDFRTFYRWLFGFDGFFVSEFASIAASFSGTYLDSFFFSLSLFASAFKAINWIYVVNWEEKCPFENFSIRIIAVIIFWVGIFHHLTL